MENTPRNLSPIAVAASLCVALWTGATAVHAAPPHKDR